MKKPGFTFIETLVVVLTLALIIPTIFTIVFTILRGQTKTIRLTVSKREGDYALNLISNTIRNRALLVYSTVPPSDSNQVCKNTGVNFSGSSIYFTDDAGSWFGYTLDTNAIASSASITDASPLTSSNTYIQNLAFECIKNAGYGLPIVTISFDICFKNSSGDCTSTRPEESSTLHYQTKIRLRNL